MAQATTQVFVKEPGKVDLTPVTPDRIGKGHRDALQALSVFPYFTAEQLARYLSLNLRYTQDNLKTRADNKYVLPLTPTKQLHAGSVPYVYTLASKGRTFVAEEGLEELLETLTNENVEYRTPTRFRPSEERKKHSLFSTPWRLTRFCCRQNFWRVRQMILSCQATLTSAGLKGHP